MGQEKESKAGAGGRYDVTVSAATQYLAEQSDETAGRYVFAYTIVLRNTGSVAAQLISRH
jgi:ApaG protein